MRRSLLLAFVVVTAFTGLFFLVSSLDVSPAAAVSVADKGASVPETAVNPDATTALTLPVHFVAPGSNCNGASPCYGAIQAAVDAASSGDVILVAQGTYTENLIITKSVLLSGGHESISWTQNITQYQTIIDGSGSQAIVGDWDGNGIYAPAVISDTGQFVMWYTGLDKYGDVRLGQASSTGGISWTKSVSNPLVNGSEAMVLKDGPSDYKMWYSGDGGQIYRATSTDGLAWIADPTPVLSPTYQDGSWERDYVSDPSIVKDMGGIYWMFYEAANWNWNRVQIGVVTSTNGIDWTRVQTTPVLSPGAAGDWDESWVLDPMVIPDGSTFKMWYSGVDISGTRRIGYALSSDGINWAKDTVNNPVLEGTPGQWDDGRAGNFFVYFDVGYEMWYASNAMIGYATSSDGVAWTKPFSNSVLATGTPGQWADPVVRFEPGSDGVVLDGFTVTGGDTDSGGGLRIANGGSALVANSIITGNHAFNWAGGVWVTNADATIRDSVIAGNQTTRYSGAGIEVNSDWGPGHLTLESATVSHNVATGNGGGLHVWDASAEVRDTTFISNTTSAGGGGIAATNGSSVTIIGTRIFSNTAAGVGGGIRAGGSSLITVTNTYIYANTSVNGEGGGIRVEDSSLNLLSSWVLANESRYNDGGGLGIGGGQGTGGSTEAYIENTVIAGNSSMASGGGVYFGNGQTYHIVNSHIVGNHTDGEGGAIGPIGPVQVMLTNTLVISNTGPTGFGDKYGSGSVVVLNYCDTYGNSPDGTVGLTVNRNNCLGTQPEDGLDPLMLGGTLPGGVGPAFADQWLNYDYRLHVSSPAVNAGTAVNAPTHDIEGNPRDSLPDIGAYEVINLADLALVKSDDPDPVLVGEALTYTLAILNNGPVTATNVVLTDTLPPGVTFVSAVPGTPTCTSSGNRVACALGSLVPGATMTVTIVATPNVTGTLINFAVATTDNVDPDLSNNADSEETLVTAVPFLDPIVNIVTPDSGLNDQATSITILGGNFQSGAIVYLGTTQLGPVTVVDAAQLQATVPAGLTPGTYDLTVVNPDSRSGILLNAFIVLDAQAAPTVTEVIPAQGPNDTPVTIDIYGLNFAPGLSATLSLSNTQVVLEGLLFIDSSHLRATVPIDAAPGGYTLTIINPDSRSGSLTNAYEVIDAADSDDLFASSLDLWLDPASIRAGDPITPRIGLIVRRQGGQATLFNVAVDFYEGGPSTGAGGTLIGNSTVPILVPGGHNSTIPVDWALPAAGDYLIYAVIDPGGAVAENNEGNNIISRTVTVLPPLSDTTPPVVDSFSINGGAASTGDRQVSLSTTAHDEGGSGVANLLYIEYEYIQSIGDWVPIAVSDWLPYDSASTGYAWALQPSPGVHYLQVWVADGAGNISLAPNSQFISYLPETAHVARGQIHVYRQNMATGQSLRVRLTVLNAGGVADLYVWDPDGVRVGVREAGEPVQEIAFTASKDGVYQFEVEGQASADYRLEVIPVVMAQVQIMEPLAPTGRFTPFIVPDDTPTEDVGLPSAPVSEYRIFLPVVLRN